METKLLIRNARENERAAIQDLTLTAYEQYGKVMPAPVWNGYKQSIQHTLEETEIERFILALREEKFVGSVILYPAEEQAYGGRLEGLSWPEIRLLATAPEERGQGIGRALMDECIQRAIASGSRLVGLHTMDMMQVAQRMYLTMGFVYTPELDFHPAPGMVVKGYLLHLDQR